MSSMNAPEARAIVHMLVMENTRLQGSMMTDVRKRQREQQEWRQREQRAHSRRLASEQIARDLRLKMDLWRLVGDGSSSDGGSAAGAAAAGTVAGTGGTKTAEIMHVEETASDSDARYEDDESAAQIELRMLQDECARLEGEARLSNLSSKSHEADAKSECAEVLSSCSQLWDNLGVPWKLRETAIMAVESSYRNQSEALLAQLQTKEQDVRRQVQALEQEKEQLYAVLGRKNRTSRRVQEKSTLLLRLRTLRETVEPMRMEVDERTFVLSVQRERIAGLSRALCREEENEEIFAAAAGLDDASVARRDSLLRALLREKSRADIQVHTVLENIRTHLAHLAKNGSSSSLKAGAARPSEGSGRGGRSSDAGGRDSALAMIFSKEIAPVLRIALRRTEDSDSAVDDALSVIHSVVVTKQMSPGCDKRSIQHLSACHDVVTKIYTSVSSVATKVRHLLSQVRAAASGEASDEAEISEEDEEMQSSLTDTMNLVAGLESAVAEDLIQTVEANTQHVCGLWDELGIDIRLRRLPSYDGDDHDHDHDHDHDNGMVKSIARFRSFMAHLSMRTDWETGDVHGSERVQQCLAYAAALVSLKQTLRAQFASTEHMRKMAAKIVEMETKAQSFESEASDKNRLRAGGSRLLEEERFRRHFVKAYPQLLSKVIAGAEAWEAEHKIPLCIKTVATCTDANGSDQRVGDQHKKTSAAVRLLLGARKVLAAYEEVLAGSRVHKEQALTLGDFLAGGNHEIEIGAEAAVKEQRLCSTKTAGQEELDEADNAAADTKTSSSSVSAATANQENSNRIGRLRSHGTKSSRAGSVASTISPLSSKSLNVLAPKRKGKVVDEKAPETRRGARSRKDAPGSSIPKPSSTSKPLRAVGITVLSRVSATSEGKSPRVAKTSRMIAERRASATAKDLENVAAEEAAVGNQKKAPRFKRRTNLRDLFG